MKHLMIAFVKAWRLLISPLYGNVCKFHPSCSAYGLESLQVHGAAKGGWLTVSRIARCHPWALGGYDPVPGTPAAAEWAAEQAQRARAAEAAHQLNLSAHSAPASEAAHSGTRKV